jgi:hypothetical protein
MAELFALTDPFRAIHPNKSAFSYSPFGTQRKNRSRIDFFLISTGILSAVTKCDIFSAQLSNMFDHKPIVLSFKEVEVRNNQQKKCVITNWFLDDPLIKMSAELASLQVYSKTIKNEIHIDICDRLTGSLNILTAKLLETLRLREKISLTPLEDTGTEDLLLAACYTEFNGSSTNLAGIKHMPK